MVVPLFDEIQSNQLSQIEALCQDKFPSKKACLDFSSRNVNRLAGWPHDLDVHPVLSNNPSFRSLVLLLDGIFWCIVRGSHRYAVSVCPPPAAETPTLEDANHAKRIINLDDAVCLIDRGDVVRVFFRNGPGLSMIFPLYRIPCAVFFKYQIARVPNESQEVSQVEQIERHAQTNSYDTIDNICTQLCKNTPSSRQFARSIFSKPSLAPFLQCRPTSRSSSVHLTTWWHVLCRNVVWTSLDIKGTSQAKNRSDRQRPVT